MLQAQQARGEGRGRRRQHGAAACDHCQAAFDTQPLNRHRDNVVLLFHAQLADECQVAGGRDHAQDCRDRAQFHHHVDLDTGVAQLAVDDVPQRAAGLECDEGLVGEVREQWNRRIATARLNRWLEDIQYHHPPPAVAGRRIRLKFITQAKTRPPTFMVHCSRPEAMPDSYSRYMINNIRETFDLWSVPVRLVMRKADNPYAMRGRKK